PIAIVLLLLAATPASSALFAAIAPPAAPTIGLPGPRDGDIILLLAKHRGIHVDRLPLVEPQPGDTIPGLVGRFATRAGHVAPSEADLAVFASLDPALVPPILALLVAVERVWDLRDAAFEGVDPKHPILSQEQERQLVEAAILLLDTLDAVVIPQLQALADAPVWPPVAVADPVGILRIGSAGNDVDTLPRAISIDGRGNDVYKNRIAYATPVDFNPMTVETPVAVAIDLQGDDKYVNAANGRAFLGIAAFYDLRGNDEYVCSFCLGKATIGVALARDVGGGDTYTTGVDALGTVAGAAGGLGYFREDMGDDRYLAETYAVGAADDSGIGMFWDRQGADLYESHDSAIALFGWGSGTADAWHIDEGAEIDTYWNRERALPYGNGRCDQCIWSSGRDNPSHFGGRGNNGEGGLAYLFAYQDTH
ncbi:MAG: hypothetical protein ACLGIK_14325, partial [Gemmatimonadota bacterium]